MPDISLVVCVYKERDLLERLLQHTNGCYDELIVVHDGRENMGGLLAHSAADNRTPIAIDFSAIDSLDRLPHDYAEPLVQPSPAGSIQELVLGYHGKFYEHPRIGSLEAQSPFGWSRTHNNWILRLDADEVPSTELKDWLQEFRNSPEPDVMVSGYACVWPLWDGRQIVTKRWPTGRIFLFHKERVRFFGMIEQVPVADGRFQAIPLTLEHKPRRKSYGLRNILLRPQAYHWRRMIAQALLGKPTNLPCWRWTSEEWPLVWEQIRRRPIRTAMRRLLGWPFRTARDMKRVEGRVIFSATLSGGIHHCLIAVAYWHARGSTSKL